MIIFAYLALILCGVFCIGFTVYEHNKLKQKDHDTELYNQSLKTSKEYLQKEYQQLEAKYLRLKDSVASISEENEDLTKDQIILRNIVNELIDKQHKLNMEIEVKKQEKTGLEAQMATINRSIEEVSSNLKATARASFEQYCDTLDYEYEKKETEFDEDLAALDQIYADKHDSLLREMSKSAEGASKQREQLEADLDIIRQELDKIRSTRAAAMDAQLREQEIKNQATFYTLQINDTDKRDIAYLQSIEFNLREPRPLRMLIWSTFYRDKVSELAARVGASGACGIYKITHIDSGISYIGQAKDIKERWVKEVKEALGIDAPATNKRCNFMREKGVDNFTFEVLEKCSIAELNEKEKFYIDLYQTYEFGLNGNKGIN